MTTCSCDLSHNGNSWVLKVIPASSMEVIDVPITDAMKTELEHAGVEIYNPDDLNVSIDL